MSPASMPLSELVSVRYEKNSGQTSSSIQLLNPLPQLSSISPNILVQQSTPIIVTGSGFTQSSIILVDGVAVPTQRLNSSSLAATISVPSKTPKLLSITVANPAPGAVQSSPFPLKADLYSITTSPQALPRGHFALTVTRPSGLDANATFALDGIPLQIASRTASAVHLIGFTPPWRPNTAALTMKDETGTQNLQLSVASSTTTYDAAQRLASQAAFGPRADVIAAIQNMGMDSWIEDQFTRPPAVYDPAQSSRSQFFKAVLMGNSVLRQRVAWAFQVLLPANGIDPYVGTWEATLERDAFTNFKQILFDSMAESSVSTFLNLPGNYASNDPATHPNQNFAREVLQLFSTGTLLLNDDGTQQLDGSGLPVPAYDQATVEGIAAALTGWQYAPPQNPVYTFAGVDWSMQLVPIEAMHDQHSKTFLGVTTPAGQTAAEDREQVIEAIFNHRNVPPFISRFLIQRLVKSQPSSSYVQRIAKVFEDNGSGVRGDLKAVIRAILLDPEARLGDVKASPSDGFVQDPLYCLLATMHLLNLTVFDDQPAQLPGQLGEPVWSTPSIFSYFSPSYTIPGTEINSPESQLLDNFRITQRSQFLWSAVDQHLLGSTAGGWNTLSAVYTDFPVLSDLVDALNHMLFHGTMPDALRTSIITSCNNIADHSLQLETAVFLALNSDYNTVVR